jgi:hypothetical protein
LTFPDEEDGPAEEAEFFEISFVAEDISPAFIVPPLFPSPQSGTARKKSCEGCTPQGGTPQNLVCVAGVTRPKRHVCRIIFREIAGGGGVGRRVFHCGGRIARL